MGTKTVVLQIGGSGDAYDYCTAGLNYYHVKKVTMGLITPVISSQVPSGVKQRNVVQPSTAITLDGFFEDVTEMAVFVSALKASAGRTATNNTFKFKDGSTEVLDYNFLAPDVKMQFDFVQSVERWEAVMNIVVHE